MGRGRGKGKWGMKRVDKRPGGKRKKKNKAVRVLKSAFVWVVVVVGAAQSIDRHFYASCLVCYSVCLSLCLPDCVSSVVVVVVVQSENC